MNRASKPSVIRAGRLLHGPLGTVVMLSVPFAAFPRFNARQADDSGAGTLPSNMSQGNVTTDLARPTKCSLFYLATLVNVSPKQKVEIDIKLTNRLTIYYNFSRNIDGEQTLNRKSIL